MKRPALFILLLAMFLTGIMLFYNRTLPGMQLGRRAEPSPLYADLARAPDGQAPAADLNLAPAVVSFQNFAISEGSAAAPASAAPPPAQAMAGEVLSAGLQRKIIGRAALELIVVDAAAVVAQINQLMAVSGGYVANANLYHANYNGTEYLQGTLNLRVPAAQMDAALAKLEKMGKEARSKTLNREDVTDQYTDLDAQLRNLQATENELRELLAEVRKKPNARPDDILTVHRSMTDIRSQIEQLQGRKNMLDNLIGLATIDVTLTPQVISKPLVAAEPEKGWQPLTVVRNATRDLVSTLQSFADVGIWLVIYFVPVVALLCIPVAILYLLWRTVMARWQRRSVVTGAGD